MLVLKRILACVCLLSVGGLSYSQGIGKKITIDPFNYEITKDVQKKKSIVACAHPLAAKVGLDIMLQGGNAVDAAIATQLALAVVYPVAGNIGGGGFMVAIINGKRIALDFREVAPAAAERDMYINKVVGWADANMSLEGPLASGVPGTVAGLFASMKYARLSFKQLVQPAIELAEKGFVITDREAKNLDSNTFKFMRIKHVRPALVKKTGWWQAGDTLVQTDLANTLKRIRDKGMDDFYRGETAKLIVQEMKNGGGIITLADLNSYKVKERMPVEFNYRGYHIITMPLPGSGSILLQQMLKMLETRLHPKDGFNTAKTVQLITEVERRAYADRAEYLGDPDFWKVPVATLTSNAYLQQRMADYDSTHASQSKNVKPGNIKESEQTTHMSIIDKDGNCVSLTTTLNGNYGSKCIVDGAGFLMNNEMDDFSVQPGVPNQYGALGGKANEIVPGKRMLSSMSPTIVLKDGKPFMIVGTPGGTTIITSVLQSIINVIDFGMDANNAVNMPKFHHQWFPDQIDVERDFPANVRQQLEDMGYKINERKPWCRIELIKLTPDGLYEATADKRGDDDAEGE